MQYLAGYIVALVTFGALDFVWLSIAGPALYRPALGDILLENLRIGPAIVFYAMFPIGLLIFAVEPAMKSGVATTALLYGALFGALAYATYDLTNYATLRNWTLQITIIDIVYGAVVSAIAAAAALFAARMIAN